MNTGIAGIIDVETTGFGPDRNEIVGFSLLLFSFDRRTGRVLEVVDEYTGLREPGCSISAGARGVHGITRKMVRGRRLDEDRIVVMLEKASSWSRLSR